MNNKLILGVAGCGKTYHIVNDADSNYKNLFLTFTNGNVKNIEGEIINKYGSIPSSFCVMTFDSFFSQHFIIPYFNWIEELCGSKIRGKIHPSIDKSPKRSINSRDSYIFSETDVRRYINSRNGVYYDQMYLYYKSLKVSDKKQVINRVRKLFDKIYVDEFQDFRELKYDFLESLIKYFPCITLVGDYYQKDIGRNNTGRPFKNRKKEITYSEFVENMEKLKLDVDIFTLSKSRRCSISISNFVNSKFSEITFETLNYHQGSVQYVNTTSDINNLIFDDKIPKLVCKNASKFEKIGFFINYGYSKGDTYDNVVVILTGGEKTTNHLYVALTRAKYNLYLIKQEDFKKFIAIHSNQELFL